MQMMRGAVFSRAPLPDNATRSQQATAAFEHGSLLSASLCYRHALSDPTG